MMELSKSLQEDIKINQINLTAAIQNHQALVLKLRGGNLVDPSDIKLRLAGIQKHILSLGEAQKVLVARVKKELAANNNAWNNHTLDKAERPNAELRVYPPSANCIDARKINSTTNQKRPFKDVKSDVGDEEDSDRKRNQDGGGVEAPPSKRTKTILHASSRPSSPVLDNNSYDQSTLPSSSDDSQESLTIDTSSEPSKSDFLSAVGLVNKEQLMSAKGNGRARRRRRYAGHHSQYSNQGHWDLTVRRHRPRVGDLAGLGVAGGGDKDAIAPISMPITDQLLEAAAQAGADDFDDDDEDDDESMGSERMMTPEGVPIVTKLEAMKQEAASSGGSSPAPTPPPPPPSLQPPLTSLSPHSLSPEKIFCTVCRKRGILSVCDICSTAFHWFCLDKDQKQCPVCLVSQVGETHNPFRNAHSGLKPAATTEPRVGAEAVAPATPTTATTNTTTTTPSTNEQLFTRYYRRAPALNSSSQFNESNGKHKKVDCWRRENERESEENSRHN